MKFTSEKKQSILFYILKKISQGDCQFYQSAKDAFGINLSTIQSYLNELQQQNIIFKIKRGTYSLVTKKYNYTLRKKNGEFDNDTLIYDKYMKDLLKDYEENIRSIWSYAISEMTSNLIEHAKADRADVHIEKNYLTTKVIIADNGNGIFNNIRKSCGLDTLEDAIIELHKGTLTINPESHIGEGIYFSSRMLDTFMLFSDGKVFTHNKIDAELINDISSYLGSGTTVYMELSNYSRLLPKQVFAQFENESGKEIIQIKVNNLFDASPVSRSQGKSLCSGLEKFKTILFDFSDVDWIGQGFAHQVFKTFAEENPDISIKPINMNEDVKRMYNHVNS